MVKKLKWNLILMSLLYVGLGIFLVMKPGTALNIVCYALGGVVLACAAVQLVRYFAVERGVFQSQLTLISGLVCLGLGAFLIIRSDIVVRILPIVFGLFVIFDSLGRIQNALELRKCQYPSWKGFLLLAVLSIVLGIVMILDPFGTMETLLNEPANHREIVGAGGLGDRGGGVREHHVRLVVIDIRPFFQQQFGKLGLSIGHRRSECLAAKLVHCDPGLLQHLDILRVLAPAHFLEDPLFLLRTEFCGLFSKECHHLRLTTAGGGEQ